MRPVLFVLEPLGLGKAWRALAIAEQLHALHPVVEPRFLAGPAAARLLRAAGRFPVVDELVPAVPDAAALAAEADAPGTLARAAERAGTRLAAGHALAALRTARALRPARVVVDGLFAAPPVLRRAGFEVDFVTDHFRDAPVADGVVRRCATLLARRAVVASTRLRFFAGEPSYLASPELRVWSRRYFRYSGPVSGLARLRVRECATLRDELGLGRRKLVVVAAGSAYGARLFEAALAAADAVASERDDVVVKPFPGCELALDDPRAGAPEELVRTLAIADAAVIGGGLSLLAECAGLRVPAVAVPLPGHPLQRRQVEYHAQRFGIARAAAPDAEAIAARLRELLDQPARWRPHDAPDADDQRRNAAFIADLIAEQLGRQRPAAPAAAAAQG